MPLLWARKPFVFPVFSVPYDGFVGVRVTQSLTVRYLFHEVSETSVRRKFNDLIDVVTTLFQIPFE
jgi:hypothetical protein